MVSEAVANIRRGVEAVKVNKNALVIQAVQMNEDAITDLVTDDQMEDRGIASTGQPITPPYTPFTTQLKKAKGQRTDHVTLKDTGAFHKSVQLRYSADSFLVIATDSKTRKLLTKYGSDVLGLTDENVTETAQIIEPDLKKLIDETVLQYVNR